MTKVTIISAKGSAAKVSYTSDEGFKKIVLIPEDRISPEGLVDDETLLIAMPYGIEWEVEMEETIFEFTGKDVARALYNNGIYSALEVTGNPRGLVAAMQELTAPIREAIARIIDKEN